MKANRLPATCYLFVARPAPGPPPDGPVAVPPPHGSLSVSHPKCSAGACTPPPCSPHPVIDGAIRCRPMGAYEPAVGTRGGVHPLSDALLQERAHPRATSWDCGSEPVADLGERGRGTSALHRERGYPCATSRGWRDPGGWSGRGSHCYATLQPDADTKWVLEARVAWQCVPTSLRLRAFPPPRLATCRIWGRRRRAGRRR